jgi:hypothetical protein
VNSTSAKRTASIHQQYMVPDHGWGRDVHIDGGGCVSCKLYLGASGDHYGRLHCAELVLLVYCGTSSELGVGFEYV